jgi:hypothetical protein
VKTGAEKKQEQEFFPIPAQLRFCKNLEKEILAASATREET